jgi:putative transcriptional regulator
LTLFGTIPQPPSGLLARVRSRVMLMAMTRLVRLLALAGSLIAPVTLYGAAPPDADPKQDVPSLAGQFLIATPEMQDPRFAETVVMMIRHNRDGALGIVINRPVGDLALSGLLDAIGEKGDAAAGTVPVFQGGPVQLELSFVLHSSDYRQPETIDVTAGIAMTASPQIFRDIANKAGPKQSLIAFGYAGWGAGQLEGELARNAWFTAPADPRLVFDEDRDKVWERAMERRTREL